MAGDGPLIEEQDDGRRLWFYWCIEDVSFAWDQWVGCTITCSHGKYQGSSTGQGDPMRTAMASAVRNFLRDKDKHDYDEG